MWKIYNFKEVSSTMDVADEIIKEKQEDNIVVVSDIQLRGRGRRGREWYSSIGGLWFTLGFFYRGSLENIGIVSLLTATAVGRSIYKRFNLVCQLKWPNDVLVDGKKVAGILIELKEERFLKYFLIGVGINYDIKRYPQYLVGFVVSLSACTNIAFCSKEELLKCFLEEFDILYKFFLKKDYIYILKEYKTYDCVIGKEIEIVDNSLILGKGSAIDIKEDGSLLLVTCDKKLMNLPSGDISLKFKQFLN